VLKPYSSEDRLLRLFPRHDGGTGQRYLNFQRRFHVFHHKGHEEHKEELKGYALESVGEFQDVKVDDESNPELRRLQV
jgi:hypothetical protein